MVGEVAPAQCCVVVGRLPSPCVRRHGSEAERAPDCPSFSAIITQRRSYAPCMEVGGGIEAEKPLCGLNGSTMPGVHVSAAPADAGVSPLPLPTAKPRVPSGPLAKRVILAGSTCSRAGAGCEGWWWGWMYLLGRRSSVDGEGMQLSKARIASNCGAVLRMLLARRPTSADSPSLASAAGASLVGFGRPSPIAPPRRVSNHDGSRLAGLLQSCPPLPKGSPPRGTRRVVARGRTWRLVYSGGSGSTASLISLTRRATS